MESENVQIEIVGKVAVATICTPPANALTPELRTEFMGKLGDPEVNLGLIPGAGGTQRLPRAAGPGWANYLLFTGDAISAEKASGIGLVQKVVPLTDLRGAALEIADRINSKGPLAVRAAKRVSAKGPDMENEAFCELCETHDKNEGVTAFLEKRKPEFQGK